MSRLAKILIVFAAIVMLGCSQKQQAANTDKSVSISVDTPTGSVQVSVNAGVTEAEVGVPFYPNTKPAKGGVGAFSAISRQPGQSEGVFAVDLVTTDPIESVIQFYTQRLGKPSFDHAGPDGYSATWNIESIDKKSDTYITVASENNKPGIVTIAILKTTAK